MVLTFVQKVGACIALAVLAIGISAPSLTLAQDCESGSFTDGIDCVKKIGEKSKAIQEGKDDVPKIIENVINFLLGLVALIALAAIIWGGFMYIGSLGDDQRVSKAKRIIMYAVIGLVVIGISAVAVNLVIDEVFSGGNGGNQQGN